MQLRKPDTSAYARPAPKRRWSVSVRLLAAVGLVSAACLACGSNPTHVSTTSTDPPLLVHDVRRQGDDAEISGILRYLDDSSCFVLESVDSAVEIMIRDVLVWPPGTTPWREGGALVGVMIPWTGIIRLGDRIDGGGGYANPGTSTLDLPEVPDECITRNGEFAMLHSLS